MKVDLLIIDDHADYVSRVVELISSDPDLMYISTANDYAGAVQALTHTNPHIVILDLNLPDKSGIDVLRFIRERKIKARVIMITNHATPVYKKLCIELGANYFLDKSNDFDMIPSVIETICTQIRN